MTRGAVIALCGVLVMGAAFYFGTRWDSEQKAAAKVDTLERISDADTSKGDESADRVWVHDFLDGLRATD